MLFNDVNVFMHYVRRVGYAIDRKKRTIGITFEAAPGETFTLSKSECLRTHQSLQGRVAMLEEHFQLIRDHDRRPSSTLAKLFGLESAPLPEAFPHVPRNASVIYGNARVFKPLANDRILTDDPGQFDAALAKLGVHFPAPAR